jgi:hypothetical protein
MKIEFANLRYKQYRKDDNKELIAQGVEYHCNALF